MRRLDKPATLTQASPPPTGARARQRPSPTTRNEGESSMSLIPATILTGFLGSGKTTLLKRVLTEAHGQKIAVIENEFGDENIDNEILVQDSKEQIIQLNNGCVCCSIREDLRTTLADLAPRARPCGRGRRSPPRSRPGAGSGQARSRGPGRTGTRPFPGRRGAWCARPQIG